MSNSGRLQEKEMRDQDTEGQVSKETIHPARRLVKALQDLAKASATALLPLATALQPFVPPRWNVIFAASSVFAVIVDPLFFYVPLINEDSKCLSLDKRLKIVAITLRSLTDAVYLLNIIFECLCPYTEEASRKLGRPELIKDPQKIAKRYLSSCYFLVDALAVFPVPQILYPIIFSEIGSSKFLGKRKFLNTVVIMQYVPKVIRVHISWMDLSKASNRADRWWVKAGFSLFLYILAGHVLGAFWYFISIQQETACWHIACEKDAGCHSTVLNCEHRSSGRDQEFLKGYCSVNAMHFDFGIFSQAIESGTLKSIDFPQKIAYCFWWGLKNLSSLGQNLQTSTYFWENCFAVSISISGLVLYLLFIENAQTYIQAAAETTQEIKLDIQVKKLEIDLWISKNQLPKSIKLEIVPIIRRKLKERKEVDVCNLFSHLPPNLGKKIKCLICLPLIKKVPQLEGKKERLKQLICDYLKPVYYDEHSYIVREGEPLDAMLFITQGIIWKFATGNGVSHAECIERGNFYGEELLDWGFKDSAVPSLSKLPISSKTVKTHTKVEAFALMANDLRVIVSRSADVASAAKEAVKQTRQRVERKNKIEKSPSLPGGNVTSNK